MTTNRILLIALFAVATYTVTVMAGKCTPEDGEFDAEKCRVKCEKREVGSGENSKFEAADRGGAKNYRCSCDMNATGVTEICKDPKFDPADVETGFASLMKSPLLALVALIAASPFLRA